MLRKRVLREANGRRTKSVISEEADLLHWLSVHAKTRLVKALTHHVSWKYLHRGREIQNSLSVTVLRCHPSDACTFFLPNLNNYRL